MPKDLARRRGRIAGRRRPPYPAPRGGFTLLEAMMVVVLLSVTTAVALPRIHAMVAQESVNRTAEIVAGDLRTAFTSAARGRVPVRLVIPPGASGYALTSVATGDTILQRDFSTGDLHVGTLSHSALTLDVFPNGIAAGTDTITVQSGPYSRRVSVSRVGFIRVLP